MRVRPSLFALAAALVVIGCGGTIDLTADTTSLDGGAEDADAYVDARADAHEDAMPPLDAPADAPVDAPPADAFDAYGEPTCPDLPIEPPQLACDPYSQRPGDCDEGQSCFPYVQYPSGPCEQERYGTYCAPAGYGVQGSPCSGGDCAGGFTCVISGSGVQCVKLCKLDQPAPCEDGLVCEPMDIPGFGGCL